MADDDVAQDIEAGKGGKKTIIIFAGVVLVAVGLSVGGTLFLMQDNEPAVIAEADSEVHQTAIYHNIRPAFIVNYLVGSKQRMLQAELTLMARDPGVVEEVVNHAPLIRSEIIKHLTGQDFLQLQGPEGKQLLQVSLVENLNGLMRETAGVEGIENVLFTNFVMQ